MTQPVSHIAIFGAGLSGLAAYQRARDLGIKCVIDDDKPIAASQIDAKDAVPFSMWDWTQLDALIISPGVPLSHPSPHAVVTAARAHNVEVISEIEFALRTGQWGKLVVITGTNGKSTTTALAGHILNEAGYDVAVGGNLGTPHSALRETETGITILELSSYQLESTPSLQPDIGCLLNITPDHLDRHGGLEGYIEAKKQVLSTLSASSLGLIGADGPLVCDLHEWAQRLPASVEIITAASLPYSLENPYLAGAHNAQNAAFAARIAQSCGVSDDAIAAALANFIGLPHRLTPVAEIAGVSYVNDSKATNGDAASRALSAYQNIHWLAGGVAKEDGIGACLDHQDHIKAAYFYGQSASAFAEETGPKLPHSLYETMDDALKAAIKAAIAGDVILLSPAAASFDQFDNFSARGSHFVALVMATASLPNKEVSHAR